MNQKKLIGIALSIATVAAGVLLAEYLVNNVDAVDDLVSGGGFFG